MAVPPIALRITVPATFTDTRTCDEFRSTTNSSGPTTEVGVCQRLLQYSLVYPTGEPGP
jgi:hypothetical protein